MATYELKNHTAFSGHELKANTLFDRLRSYFTNPFAVSEERRAYLDTLHELQVLTDRDLADIGISRGDIYRIAQEAADAKRVNA
jgi:uncharacterized protein YjiS (DUF1127 family)